LWLHLSYRLGVLFFILPEVVFVDVLINFDGLRGPHLSGPTCIGLACLLRIALIGVILILLLRVLVILLISVLILLAEGVLRVICVGIVVLIVLLVVVCLVVLIVIVRILCLLIRWRLFRGRSKIFVLI